MSIKKGNTTIGAIYKGTTQIAKVYKGTTLLFENAVWLDYYYKNLYHSLVPQTLPKSILNNTPTIDTVRVPFSQSTFTKLNASTTYTLQFDELLNATTYRWCLSFYDTSGNLINNISNFTFSIAHYFNDNGLCLTSNNISVSTKSLTITPSVNCYIYVNFGLGDTSSSTIMKNPKLYSKSLNVHNKARVKKIYGNSEVVNQLVATSDVRPLTTTTTNGITFTNNNDGSITISGTATADFYQPITRDIPISVQGHSWLIFSELLGDSSKYWISDGWSGAIINNGNGVIRTINTSYVILRFNIKSGVQINQTIHPQLVNLTQRYPFDTPTTLTDNRVRKILAQGYIPYNTGKIKDMEIGEFSSEPYNLFDGEWEQGRYDLNTGLPAIGYVGYYRTKNKIKVIGGRTYTISRNENCLGYLYEYDEDNNFLGNTYISTNTTNDFVLKSNTAYINISLGSSFATEPTNACIHITGTRTGYSKHLNQLPKDYQEVEYIESSGTQYIDTGYKPTTDNMEAEIKCKLPSDTGSLSLFGANANSYPYFLTPYTNSSYGTRVFKHWIGNSGGILSITLSEISVVKYKINNGTLTCNVNGSQTSSSYSGSIQCGYNIFVFCKNNYGTPIENGYGYALYSFKLYDNNVLVRDFVPCYRKSDNVIGLFDLVQQKFYSNAGSGTFLKGANVQNTTSLQLPALYKSSGIGTSKDSWENTNTSHIFTRNNFYVDLGLQNWTYENVASGDNYYTDIIPNSKTSSSVLCEKYGSNTNVSPATLRNNAWISASGRINITADGYSGNTNNFKTAMSGVILKYPLATPQVITIPKKHLGIVRIRDLSWFLYSTGIYFAQISNLKLVNGASLVGNITTSKYLTTSIANLFSTDNVIACGNNESQVYVKDTSVNNTTDLLNKYGDYLIFYETENEVADITDTFDIEAGGSVNGNLFSWVRNQLVNKSTLNSSASNISVDTNTGKVELDLSTFVKYANTLTLSNGNEYIIDLVQGHKYLLRGFKTTSTPASDNSWWIQVRNNSAGVSGRLYNENEIFTANNGGLSTIFIYVLNNYTANDKIVGYPQLIDLTTGFGAGNEPTDINDYRIQYILKYGYILTDISGTYTNETCDVLPNVDFSMKCK